MRVCPTLGRVASRHINGFLSDTTQPITMKAFKEQRLQMAALRLGLRVVLDRYPTPATGTTKYLLRSHWNARRAVRVRPDASYELAMFPNGQYNTATRFSLLDLETFLARWSGPIICAPALLPWQTFTKPSADLRTRSG